jgi:hypothetical protein
MVACDTQPSLSTLNTSRLVVAFSVTIKNCPSGLNATEPDATALPLKLNPTTLPLPVVFDT